MRKAEETIIKKSYRPNQISWQINAKDVLDWPDLAAWWANMASPHKSGIMAYAPLETQEQLAGDPLSEPRKIAQSKVKYAALPCVFGDGIPALYNLTTQDVYL